MSSILSTVSAMRLAAPAPALREHDALGLQRREDEKRTAEDKQKGEENLSGSAVSKLSEGNRTLGAESVKTKELTAPQQTAAAPVVDQYVRGQEAKPIGLYRIAQDENGGKKILFDDPEKEKASKEAAPKDAEKAAPRNAENAPEKAPETTTGNTDKVEREIRKLKEKLESLKQQLARAQDNPEEQAKLEKQIAQVENELRAKDTDSYRRQNTQFS